MAEIIQPGPGKLRLPNAITTSLIVDRYALFDPRHGLGGLRTVDYINIDAIPDWNGTDTGVDYARNDRVESTMTAGTYYILSVDNLVAAAANVDPEADIVAGNINWTLLSSTDLDNLSFRDLIPLERQQLGMIVYAEDANSVVGGDTFYRLTSFSPDQLTDLTSNDWENLLISGSITLSDPTNFGMETTVQGALDTLALQLNAVSPGGFQGDWDGQDFPITTPPSDMYTQGDFWILSADVTRMVGTPPSNVLIQTGDLIYYNNATPTDTLTDLEDFFVVSTMQIDISGLVDDINEAAGGTFTFVTQGDPTTLNPITVVTQEANPSVTIDPGTRAVATRGNIIPVAGGDIQTSGTTVISETDTVRTGLNTLNTKIDTGQTTLNTRITDLNATDIALKRFPSLFWRL